MAMSSERYSQTPLFVRAEVVIFTILGDRLGLLLGKRGRPPDRGRWALPGGFVPIDEDLESSALRKLGENTLASGVYLEQLYTFGSPDRDPRGRVISVAYYALIPADPAKQTSGHGQGRDAGWFTVDALPELALDHADIVAKARRRLVSKLDYSTIALQLLPKTFTLRELQDVYEILLGAPLDKRNFRKWVLAMAQLEETGGERRDGPHRPAKLYRHRFPGQVAFFR